MNQTLTSALWITLIGMGLVFISLFLLWGLMELMVRLTSRAAAAAEEPAPETASPAPCGDDLALLKAKAAATAVAFATVFTAQADGPGKTGIPAPPLDHTGEQGTASAWQSANRASQINQNAALYNRKPRGNE